MGKRMKWNHSSSLAKHSTFIEGYLWKSIFDGLFLQIVSNLIFSFFQKYFRSVALQKLGPWGQIISNNFLWEILGLEAKFASLLLIGESKLKYLFYFKRIHLFKYKWNV